VTSASAAADATVPRKYTVFDLAANGAGIPVVQLDYMTRVNDGYVSGPGGATLCHAVVAHPYYEDPRPLVVPYDPTCSLFTQVPTGKIVVRTVTTTDCTRKDVEAPVDCAGPFVVEFDAGEPIDGSFDGGISMSKNVFHVSGANTTAACVARWVAGKWILDDVSLWLDGASVRMTAALAGLSRQGSLYLRAGKCAAAVESDTRPFVVNYTPAQKTQSTSFPNRKNCTQQPFYKAAPPDPNDKTTEACQALPAETIEVYPNARILWTLYVDQASDKGIPRITHNPNNYLLTNSFGRVRVRHWKNVQPSLTTSGTGTALTNATSDGGVAATDATPLITGSLLTTDGEALVTEFLVPPHAPGTMHLLVKFTDVDDPSKPRGEAGTELIVDRVYSSALRFGVARVFDLKETQYKAIQHEKDKPYEITRKLSDINEIVLGYALYLDWLLPGHFGRSYNLTSAGPWERFIRHAGLYAGFGAVTYAAGNFDYLKSFHVGLEIELKNFSIAGTFVTRRTPSLNSALRVGDEIPTADIDTVDQFRWGVALVANFSTEFLRFTAGGIK
jgi:hypothetical protein